MTPTAQASLWRRTALGLATLWLAQLVACGPGVGGTGTGASTAEGGAALIAFSASAAPVCIAPTAGSPNCTNGTSASTVSVVFVGTEPLRYIDASQGSNIVLDLQDNSARLSARCQRLGFIGDWGLTPTIDSRFFGSSLVDGAMQRELATLAVQAAPAGAPNVITVVLRDAQERVLLGPLQLVPAPATLPPPPPCP